MQAHQQYRLAALIQRVRRHRLRRDLEEAFRQRHGGVAHVLGAGGLHQPWRARDDPLAQDRRQLLPLQHAPDAQFRVEPHAFGHGIHVIVTTSRGRSMSIQRVSERPANTISTGRRSA